MSSARVDLYCDHGGDVAERERCEVDSLYRRDGLWFIAKRCDENGRRVRSRSVTVLDGDETVDAQLGNALRFFTMNGEPTGGLRERIEAECPACHMRAEIRLDNPKLARILDAFADQGRGELSLLTLKTAIGRNV